MILCIINQYGIQNTDFTGNFAFTLGFVEGFGTSNGGDSIEHSSPRPLSHANTKGLVIIIEWKARITFKCIIELIYQKKKKMYHWVDRVSMLVAYIV